MQLSRLLDRFALPGLAMVAVLAKPGPGAPVSIDDTCKVAAPQDTTQFSGSNLNTNVPVKSGVVYSASGASLGLVRQGATFKQTSINIGEPVFLACGGDFDKDGWTDFIGAGPDSSAWAKFYKNNTKQNSDLASTSDWLNANFVVTPKFTKTGNDIVAGSSMGGGALGCGDVNKDGKDDYIYVRCTSGNNCAPSVYKVFLGNGNGTFQAGYNFTTNTTPLSYMGWSGNSFEIVDWNGDGWPDLVYGVGTGTGATNDGKLYVLLSDKQASPKFGQTAAAVITLTSSPGLLPRSGFNATGINAVSVADFNHNGTVDVIVGGSSGANAPMYRDKNFSSGVISNLTSFTGGSQTLIPADYDLDGKLDLMIATDGKNGRTGEKIFYYKNNGTNSPFSGNPTVLVNGGLSSSGDLDLGFAVDYDHDPYLTPDLMVSDGNDSGKFFILANRAVDKYVTCGTVESALVDVGNLGTSEATVTEVRLSPTQTLPAGTSVTYWASVNGSDASPTWVLAQDCGNGQLCASFTTIGTDIKWKAQLCSNGAQSVTPTIAGVKIDYSYVGVEKHFRAGPIARDGLIYLGAASMPGDRGWFFALNDQTGATVWEAGALLETNDSRKIFVAAGDGVVELSSANASSSALQGALDVGSTSAASAVISWVKSARFGLVTKRVFGGIEGSTAALLSRPSEPGWYLYKSTLGTQRTAIDAFVEAHAARTQLVFVGSKDGMLHAFYTNPANHSDPLNGKEMWAFIPPAVASELAGDTAADTVSHYVDGSPALADVLIGEEWKTVLIMGQGAGGESVFALDVTNTVEGETVNGPRLLWSFTDPDMGDTLSKPAIVRVKVGDEEKWLAVFASGPGGSGDGDTLYAVDIATGELVWRFEIGDSGAYISSDIAGYETDDEQGTSYDGFIDRLVFGDSKGRVFKVAPAVYSNGSTAAIGSVSVSGVAQPALFATESLTALGVQRGIGGTLGVSDNTSGDKSVLYVGTGGAGTTGNKNGVFAIDLASGAIVDSYIVNDATRFIGGVTVAHGQLVTTGSKETGSGLCSPSTGEVSSFETEDFDSTLAYATNDKFMGPAYIRNGQVYLVTESGTLMTSAYMAEGEGLASGGGGGGGELDDGAQNPNSGPDQAGELEDPFTIVSWRQVY